MALAVTAAVAISAVRARAKSEEKSLGVVTRHSQFAQSFSGGSNVHRGRSCFCLLPATTVTSPWSVLDSEDDFCSPADDATSFLSYRVGTQSVQVCLCVGSPFRPARFGRSSACGHRTLQTLRQPPRQRGHAQIPTGGADTVRAQHFFQEVPAVPRYSRRRFDPPPAAGGGADHRSSVGTGARWRHRGAIQDAVGGTL